MRGKCLRLNPVVSEHLQRTQQNPSPKEPVPLWSWQLKNAPGKNAASGRVSRMQPEETRSTCRCAAAWSHWEKSHLKPKGTFLWFIHMATVSTPCQTPRGERADSTDPTPHLGLM